MLYNFIKNWQPFVLIIAFLIFWFWESLSPFFSNSKNKYIHGRRNIFITLINIIILSFIFGGIIFSLSEYSLKRQIGLLYYLKLDSNIHSIIAFLIVDVWTYWWHRINHVVPFLWRFHRMHHSDPEMDVTTASRFHFGEIIFSSLFRIALIPLFGIPIWVFIFYDFFQMISTMFHHSNISLPVEADKFLSLIIVSPNMHKVHHSRIKSETDSNYTSLLSIWDRLFGSFKLKENYKEIKFGLNNFDNDNLQTVKGMIKTPFIRIN